METKKSSLTASSRRIFITENDSDFFQLFSFSQNENEGSIYISWPDINNSKWIFVDNHYDPKNAFFLDSPGEGKISFHGSGQVHFKTHIEQTSHFKIEGNILHRIQEQRTGLRHLLTIFQNKPEFQPQNSPVFNRQTDFSLKTTRLQPMFLVLLAIPKKQMKLNLNFSLRADDMEKIPEDILGFVNIPMNNHDILCIAYKTKHLDNFPVQSHIMYTDGFLIPLFIGRENNTIVIELTKPEYEINGDVLNIRIGISEEQNNNL